jgi:superoxide dismutase
MHEHSYYIGYNARAAAYVDALMATINWPNPARNFAEIRC